MKWTEPYPSPRQFIDGRWCDGPPSAFQVIDPASGDVLAAIPDATERELDLALSSAQAAFASWAKVPAWERGAILAKAGAILRREIETIARWLTLEQGKPLAEARAEVNAAADVFVWVSEECKRTYGRTIPSRMPGLRQVSELEPVGPSALFSPWNFPIVLPTRKVATALAAGCSCILKPAEQTPASAMALALACHEAGVPRGALNMVLGDPQRISSGLIRSDVIRKVSLTGSVAVGRAVARLAGEHLKKCTLELGGHAPVIVFGDCDLELAVATLVRTKYRNAGQVCVSPTRILVEDGIAAAFTERFVAEAGGISVGSGLDPASQMGPLTTARRRAAVDAMVRDAEKLGAKVLAGGNIPNGPGHFYPATVLADPAPAADAMNSEPFGPIALISRFSDPGDAIAEANRLPMGLAAYLFTNHLGKARSIGERLQSGMVGINHIAFGLPETPMCGVKDSGYGHEGSVEGIREYMVTKFINEYSR
ncbi:MAG TPA: NAD-dependent succinate-semialdehyde dehydrogenase [Dongiaceae bacterium]|nr:NAD-dependent succinate-semialdehyde dehydrogenase [Dongiaceae bacterium]